jgi:hypothetical protein
LADENPVSWLASGLVGYAGALYDPALGDIPPGSWYFDLKNKELVYRPQRTRYFSAPPESTGRIRYRVVLTVSEPDSRTAAMTLSDLDVRPAVAVNWSPEF